MKIVVLTSLPRPALLPDDFLPYHLQRQGIAVAAVIARRVSFGAMVRAHQSGGGILRRIRELVSQRARSGHGRVSAAMGTAGTPRTPIPLHYVEDHNSPACVALVKSLAPDLLVVGGRSILKPRLLSVPKVGTLGCHFALLPEFRGSHATEWAILESRPIGVSIVWLDAGVDTGDVLIDRRVAILPGETIASLHRRSGEMGKALFVDGIQRILDGDAAQRPQAPGAGRRFFRMHPRLRRAAATRLAALSAS